MYNSVPVFMQDKQDELTRYRIVGGHYIFTDESAMIAAKILSGAHIEIPGAVRRISK